MRISTWHTLEDIPTDAAIAVFFIGDEPTHPEVWATLQQRYGGWPGQVLQRRQWKGKLGDTVALPLPDRDGWPLYVAGLKDEYHPLSTETLRRACGLLGRMLQADRVTSVALVLPVLEEDMGLSVRAAVEGLRLGQYGFRKYRGEEEETPVWLEHLALWGIDARTVEPAVEMAEVMAEATALARDLVNEPPVVLTPARIAEIAAERASSVGLQVRVLDERDLEAMGAGAFLSVGRGSENPPRLVHIHYRPEVSQGTPIGLVGKGITFDSGGLCLKPASSMLDMKGDMAGAAAVLAALWAIGRLRPPVEVHGVLCCAENMPSGRASRPGDIVRAMNGKTVEITNTDAEGRLVLADGLVYAVRQGAQTLIDVATLTGAAVIALGTQIAAILTNDEALQRALLASARKSGEVFWPLPLEREYRNLLKSEVATLKNSSGAREAGTITGAIFLSEFTEGRPWAHLDIAGPFWAEKPSHYLAPGGTGFGTRSLIQFVLDRADAG